jgi:hypothetical protein
VIGAIDGTLIPIQGLSGAEEPNFVCRKGYHAINVQAVADHNLNDCLSLSIFSHNFVPYVVVGDISPFKDSFSYHYVI